MESSYTHPPRPLLPLRGQSRRERLPSPHGDRRGLGAPPHHSPPFHCGWARSQRGLLPCPHGAACNHRARLDPGPSQSIGHVTLRLPSHRSKAHLAPRPPSDSINPGYPLMRECVRSPAPTRTIKWIKGHPESTRAPRSDLTQDQWGNYLADLFASSPTSLPLGLPPDTRGASAHWDGTSVQLVAKARRLSHRGIAHVVQRYDIYGTCGGTGLTRPSPTPHSLML